LESSPTPSVLHIDDDSRGVGQFDDEVRNNPATPGK
jgi:hypothetical protein